MLAELVRYFDQGGNFMYVIALVSIVAMAIIIERIIFIVFRYNVNGMAFMAQIKKFILSNNIDRAIKLANSHANAALPYVIKAGLLKANKSTVEIQNAVDEASLEVLPKLQKRTAYLSMIANVATLLGLLGTIYGLITAFSSLQFDDASSRTGALAYGISIAMYTTAFGLIVAIPCMAAFSFLQSKTLKIIDEIDQFSVKLVNLLTTRETITK